MKWFVITSIFFLITAGFCQVSIAGGDCLKVTCVEEEGVQKTEKRSVGAFDSVDIKGSFHFVLVSGDNCAIEITCDRNLLPNISTEVKNQKLSVFAKKSFCTTKGIKILITAPDFRSIDASGSNDIFVKGIDNEGISISLDGAGSMNLSGNTREFEAHLAGSNHLCAKNLRSGKTSLSIAGSSDAIVYASEVLDISIGGVGDIKYYGNPKTVLKNIAGIGTIEPGE